MLVEAVERVQCTVLSTFPAESHIIEGWLLVVDSIFVSYESVGVGGRLGHAVPVVSTDILSCVCDASQDPCLRMMPGASVASWTLADGVGIHFVDLFVSSPRAEQFAWLLS